MNWRSLVGNFFGANKFLFKGEVIDGLTKFNEYEATKEKLEIILKNFALLRVFSLQCDLFSMAKFYVVDVKSGEYILDDRFLDFIKQPNPFQTQSDFMWSFMFNHMMGKGDIWGTSKLIENSLLRLYILDNWKIEIPDNLTDFDKLVESDTAVKELMGRTLTYNYNDGTSKSLKFSDIMSVKDLNVGGNWFSYSSRIDALYKIISNFEESLNSENINIRYAGKFIVAGKTSLDDTTKSPMSNTEKQDVEGKMLNHNPVHAMKSAIDIKRFIDSVKGIGLTESERAAFYAIANMYGIPEEVVKVFAEKGSTWENQEKGRGGYVDYVLEPKGEKLCTALNNFFGYNKLGKKIIVSWDHLAFMQVFEKEKAEIQDKKALTMERLLKLNVPLEEINKFLDTEFTEAKYVQQAKTFGGATQTGANQD